MFVAGPCLVCVCCSCRRPLFDQYTAQLEKECDRYWKSGHQMCEVLSLSGNRCTNRLHRGGGEGAGSGELQGEANKLLDEADSSERFVTYQYVCNAYALGCLFSNAATLPHSCSHRRGICIILEWAVLFLLTEVCVLCYQPLSCSSDSIS